MKIESFIVGVLILGGTDLFVRIPTQGIEPALVATAIDWSDRRIRAAMSVVREIL
jgi:hypothetical protein